MGLIPTFSIEKRQKTPVPSHDFWYTPIGSYIPTQAGVPVSEENALKYLTLLACVTLISGDIGKIPLNMYKKRADGGNDLVTNHRLYDLLHNAPNSEMTSFNWREAAQGHLLLWGNHYSFIARDGTGAIIELWPLPNPGQVEVKREGSRILYKYKVDGKDVIRDRSQIFHIPGYGFNGLYGMSMISLSREAIGLGLGAEDFGSRYFGAGTHPSGTIEMEGFLGDRREEYQKYLKEGYAGLGKSHALMLLEGGAKYNPLTMPMDDAQFLETRNHQKTEICGMYHVPPHKIALHGQNANYNNLEQENAGYVDTCLMSWIVRWEQHISLQLLTLEERLSGLYFKFQVQGLLRGDSVARADYYNKMLQIGSMTPDEIRAKEEMNPIEGGDRAFIMLNLQLLEDAGKEMALPGDDDIPDEEDEPEEEEEERQRLLIDFFSEARAMASIKQRSIVARDRIAEIFHPLIEDTAQVVVNREAKAIKNRLKTSKGATKEMMADFLDEFYEKFPEYVVKRLGPIMTSFMAATVDESVQEVGVDTVNLEMQIREYVENYARRHTDSSYNQMVALLEGELEDLAQRADEWQDTRAGKIANDEKVRASSAAFSFVVFAAGLSLTWRIRGPRTCPYCQVLNGMNISSEGAFVQAGGKVQPEGVDEPMKSYSLKRHPPLHQGCDCYVSI